MNCCCRRKNAYAWIAILAGATCALRLSAFTVPEQTPLDTAVCLESFDHVWTTVRDKHWDPKLNDVPWDAVRDELRPRAEKAKNADELDGILNEMLSRLEQSHFGIIPKSAYEPMLGDDGDSESSQDGTVGVELRWIEGQPTAWRLQPGSSASDAGIRTGWILTEVSGKTVTELTASAERLRSELIDPELLKQLIGQRMMQGAVGNMKRFVWLDAEDQRREIDMEFRSPSGQEAKFGNLPTMHVDCQSSMIEGDIPVFRLNLFFDPPRVLKQFEALVREHNDAPGMILDLRGNIGGLGFMAMSMGSWLTETQGQQLGTMTTRSGSLNFTLNPRTPAFRGKVAVLVDELSMSTSEILAGGLQDTGLARVFGRKTPGMALPSAIEKLPHGAGFQYAYANYLSADGQPLEGQGVIPDERIELTRDALLGEDDPDTQAALRWIRSQ